MPTSFLSKLNLSIASGFERAVLGPKNSRNLLLGQGKLFSRNSVQDCSKSRLVKAKSMAAANSTSVFGDVNVEDRVTAGSVNSFDLTKLSGVFFNEKSSTRCQRAALSLKRTSSKNFHVDISPVGPRLRNLHRSSSACYSTGAAHDVSSFEGNSPSEQNPNPTALSDEATLLGDRSLKLLSGVCYLPHPDKEATGGEDAHFICIDEQVIGVADGVGGWADVGVNAGLFSRQLMSNSVAAIQDEPKDSIDPARVLVKAHAGTNAKGSSTACILALTEKGLHAINLGDSGFIVVRDGCTVFQSPVQQHGFNFTYQLESGSGADLPSAGQVFMIPVSCGDVVVAGTDGLFDNLYNNEITAVVLHAVRAGLEPSATAQKIAALARQRAMDKTRQTPFATAAQEAGFRYYGGKLDDITVVVSYVSTLANV